jgi:NAD(P)H-hydrate epimerase
LKLFTAQQIRDWDKYTIEHEPISSIDLMERAARAFTEWFIHQFEKSDNGVTIVCGTGNNGGDGLAIARLLRNRFYNVEVILCGDTEKLSHDASVNYQRLIHLGDIPLHCITPPSLPQFFQESRIIVDALFGSGLSRPLEGWYQKIVEQINQTKNATVISIDLPSGLPTEGIAEGVCIKADITCTFQIPKLSFLKAENSVYTGQCVVLDIGLSADYASNMPTDYIMTDKKLVKAKLRKRNTFDHKGTNGHCLIMAGSQGKTGAALLCAKACIKTGAGLVTAFVPDGLHAAMNVFAPEIMTVPAGDRYIVNVDHQSFDSDAVAAGPGLGTMAETVYALEAMLLTYDKPAVLDADALNILAQNKRLLKILKPGTIITPHPGEFDRLFGRCVDSQQRLDLQIAKSKELNIIIVLKGAYSSITTPDGMVYFNSTGNPGMATAGSGDVLTGMIGSLLGQGYSPLDAAITGVFVHGLAGDLALKNESMESLTASDIILNIGAAFKHIQD